MTPNLCTCTWLLLPCCVLITLSTGELKFYRDEVPETSERLMLRQLVKYLEKQSERHQDHQQRSQRSHFNPFLASQTRSKHQLEPDWPKEKYLLEALANKEQKEWNYERTRYNEPVHELPREREHYLPFYELNPFHNPLGYPNFKLPYLRENPAPQDEGYDYERNAPFKHSPFKQSRDLDKGMKEEPTLDFRGSYSESMNEDDNKLQKPHLTTPEFTFRFDDSNLKERQPFAVKPNDPRYYQDGPFSLGDNEKSNFKKPEKNESKWEQVNTIIQKTRTTYEEDTGDAESKNKETPMANTAVPELERRTGHYPLVVPVNHDLNTDIYFIAIVAGCSAAAMFALVLITLTWCRLKRGAKAAADIEYPAYGVTGPNKEVSPSGDQRLAQSAQMYHFQHQKQQIIAMENRVSASRDPGSVSEAESEEENEEGDYTVYECPGLATTGEMEVKNPLFHDDPTPATPAQTNKEEDHK